MKQIVQIAVAQQGENESVIYGIDSEGALYMWRDEAPAWAYKPYNGTESRRIYAYQSDYADTVREWQEKGYKISYGDGHTAGWLKLGFGESLPVVSTLDPTRHERS